MNQAAAEALASVVDCALLLEEYARHNPLAAAEPNLADREELHLLNARWLSRRLYGLASTALHELAE
ncbi:MAG: hypothetical protein ABFS34_03020 [Gemmatimonadota bacterium]